MSFTHQSARLLKLALVVTFALVVMSECAQACTVRAIDYGQDGSCSGAGTPAGTFAFPGPNVCVQGTSTDCATTLNQYFPDTSKFPPVADCDASRLAAQITFGSCLQGLKGTYMKFELAGGSDSSFVYNLFRRDQ
eukprot:GFYU01006854.1.p1 GENE.GFYU01006854.1~~GFYU01006854.1.p1  ORF type:complete len:135 (+),score=39.02 GFYU01006854.1:97-501(+)